MSATGADGERNNSGGDKHEIGALGISATATTITLLIEAACAGISARSAAYTLDSVFVVGPIIWHHPCAGCGSEKNYLLRCRSRFDAAQPLYQPRHHQEWFPVKEHKILLASHTT